MNIDDLKQRIRLKELFGTSERMVCCPFHQEKTPSCSVNHEKNLFRCWGCDKAGSPIDFLVYRDGISDAEAIRRLAEMAGVELEPPTPEYVARLAADRRREECLAFAADHYHQVLIESGPAMKWLLDRGFTQDTIKRYRIGYADRSLTKLVRANPIPARLGDMGITAQDFVDCGLVRPNSRYPGRYHDFFFDRITFPVVHRGRVVHMAGRCFPDDPEQIKYLNLPTNDADGKPLPNSRPLDWLYAEDNVTADEVVAAEGLPDSLTWLQWGFKTVGALGTQGLKKHVKKFRHCKRVYLPWDSDAAGRKGMLETAGLLAQELENGDAYMVPLPDGPNDSNEWLQAGATADDAKEILKLAKPYPLALIESIDPDAKPNEKTEQLEPVFRALARKKIEEQAAYTNIIKSRLKINSGAIREAIRRIQNEMAKPVAKKEDPGSAFTFTWNQPRYMVPALDFHFNSPAVANVTVFLETKVRQATEDGRVIEKLEMEPVLIKSSYLEAGHQVEATPIRMMELAPEEARRIPTRNIVEGRWRPSPKHPHSVANFITGKVKELDVPRLFDDLVDLFQSYIWFPNAYDHKVLAAWTMMTYVHRLFDSLGYLHLHGVKASGKSQTARLLEELCFNAKKTSSGTESTLFRSVESNCRTYFVEEAEKLSNPKPGTSAEAIGLLCNDGYKQGANAERNEQDPKTKGWVPVSYDTFSPKVFASINPLNPVLASRCIQILCLPATGPEREGLRDYAQNKWREMPRIRELRDRLYCWALLYFPDLHRIYTETLVDHAGIHFLRGREREMWLPLLTIAWHIDELRFPGDTVPERDEDILSYALIQAQKVKAAESQKEEGETNYDVAILQALYDAIITNDLGPVADTFDGAPGAWFSTIECCEIITAKLRESGLFSSEMSTVPKRLGSLLRKAQVIDASKKDRRRINGKPTHILRISIEALEEAIRRLGGRVGDDA